MQLFFHNLKLDIKNLPTSDPKTNPSQIAVEKTSSHLGLKKSKFYLIL